MAYPAAIKPSTFSGRIAWPSRLIPGAQVRHQSVPRKKASVITLGGQAWTWQDRFAVATARRQGFWRALAQALLPQPATHRQRVRLAMQVVADFLSISVGFTVAVRLGSFLNWPLKPLSGLFRAADDSASALGLLMLYGIVFTLLGYSERLYHPETIRVPGQERLVLAKTACWSTLLTGAALMWSKLPFVGAAPALAAVPVGFLIMLGWRQLWRRASTRSSRSNGVRNVLIIGAGRLGRELASQLQQDHVRKCVVRGFLDESHPVGGDVRGRVRDLGRIARSEFVDEIIITLPRESEISRQAIWEARRNRIDVKVVPDLFGLDPTPVVLEKFGTVPVLTLCEERIPTIGLLLKRGMDVVVSATALLLALPCLAAIALAIKLDSTGPVFYSALRLGRKGQRFRCYKFRTMVRDADKLKEKLRQCNERSGPFFKMANDPRVTRIGRILRRYSLDELPQLWNVLRGEMSLVGPRPHPLDDFERYSLEDLQRLEVSPGLTGLWQVTARRDPSFQRNMALDREYIGRWTLAMDLRILCKTLGVVLRGEGA